MGEGRLGRTAMSLVILPKWRARLTASLVAGALGAAAFAMAADRQLFLDPLDSPASRLSGADRAGHEPLVAVAASAGRTIAVGLRGVIIYADVGQPLWRQAAVPVQTDLVAAQLLDDRLAWASGHDSVILHSEDGGASWRKQFDRDGAKRLISRYQQRVNAGEIGTQKYLDQVKLNTDGDVSLPYLGVWFEDQNNGYAVGAFGMIVATHDGGSNWEPWLDHIENDEFLNLNAIRGINGEIYIAGERGMVYRFDRKAKRFVGSSTGYKGSFFDIVGTTRALIAFGLRGAAYRSTDGGSTWQAASTGVERSITAGGVFDQGRRIVLLTETGQAIQSTDDGATFQPADLPRLPPVYGAVATGQTSLVAAGFLGVQNQTLKSLSP